MKFHVSFLKLCRGALLAAAVLAFTASARAGLAVPYTPNADTLHLWHLNETNGQFAADSADLSTNAYPITLTNIGGLPNANASAYAATTYPFTNTALGTAGPGFPGLTNAYSGSNKGHLLYGGSLPDVSGLCNPTTGAFTFEALICISNNLSGDYEIFTGDSGGALTTRGWQWRFNTAQEQWDLIAGATSDNTFPPALPTSGPDAAAVGVWYHVAVTYTGNSPTNNDPVEQFKLYWTRLDPGRTFADVLVTEEGITNAQMPYGIRPLSGAPVGTAAPNIGIGGSGRNTTANVGNNEGLVGSICEVRVTDLCLKSNEMAFVAGGAIAPTNTSQPPPQLLVGYGQTLNATVGVSASQPVTYTWFQNGSSVAGQSTATLNISNTTFATGGAYYLITSNAYGSATSSVVQVTVGAIADELFSTGIVSNQVSAGDVPDPNYTLIQSGNPNFLGPNMLIWESNCPIEIICSSGGYSPNVGASMWISDQGNAGGSAAGDPSGTYTIRTHFLLDQASPASLSYHSGFEYNGTLTNILLNGLSTGFSMPSSAPLYANTFSLSNNNGIVTFNGIGTTFGSVSATNTNGNFFVPGLNTIDFVLSGSSSAMKLDSPTMIGFALPPGLPSILQQPANETVRDAAITGSGSDAAFSVVATGRSPLTYQWYSNGIALAGVTTRTINYPNPSAGNQGTNFEVVVSNDSGSVTSRVASLTLVSTNQNPIAPNYTNYIYTDQTLPIDFSVLYNQASSPDGDALALSAFDTFTTNQVVLNPVSSTLYTYTPNPGFFGQDLLTYTIQDSQGNFAVGTNFIEVVQKQAPATVAAVRSANGTSVVMSGAGGAPGAEYLILGSSDLTVPVGSWATVATGFFDSHGNFSISLPVGSGAGDGFYVLAVP
ncbi:MAG TPA: Ig-like domain-containing protein [Verrucomicrobiae bacterium]|jgi:hypothetical protein